MISPSRVLRYCLTASVIVIFLMDSCDGSHNLEGIRLPLTKQLILDDAMSSTTELLFNGAGIRSVSFFGWPVKVYVAGLYTSKPCSTAESVLELLVEQQQPMQFDFTFLRDVNQGRVTEAWRQQLEHSVDYKYDGYEKHRDDFIAGFGPIAKGGTETVQLLPRGKTRIIDQGVERQTIISQDFQKSFLSMWFGSNAVATDLKAGLLGKIAQYGLKDPYMQEMVVTMDGS